MANEFAVRLEGWTELQRSLRGVDKRLPKELQRELKAAAEIVKTEAQSIASERGLAAPGTSGRGTGQLVSHMRIFSTQKAAGVRDDATNKGFHYPAVYEYGHAGIRAFLRPAAEAKATRVEEMIGEMFDRLASSEGLGRGGIL